jgi:thiol-disulfide isomerase/thioredoxin
MLLTIVNAQDELNKNSSKDLLIGEIKRSDLEKSPYDLWFIPNYKEYNPDGFLCEVILYSQPDKIVIVLGTWCSDSKREVPRFFRVFDKLGWDKEIITMYAVDKGKTLPEFEKLNLDIERVPTFLIYNADELVGTIVETPETSFEEELIRILAP